MEGLQRVFGLNGASGRPFHPCAQCGLAIVASSWSEHVNERCVRTSGRVTRAAMSSRHRLSSELQNTHLVEPAGFYCQHQLKVRSYEHAASSAVRCEDYNIRYRYYA